MENIIIAIIGMVSALSVALIEKGRRENKSDHAALRERLDLIAKNLGRSIDRVEQAAIRTEKKIDDHINDHAIGEFKDVG
jgi:hypothetical protein